jgi:DNA-binding transcriptional LysR family regulator
MATLVELESFVLVARAGSFAAAAKQQGVSATMVARRIAGLEAEFGTRLLERTTRNQRLTPVGEMFLERTLKLIEDAEALDELKDTNDARLSGRLRISAPSTIGVTQIAALVAEFAKLHPGVDMDVSFTNRRVDLVSEGYDLAIRVGAPGGMGLVARKLGTYRLTCCASPALLERYGVPVRPSDIALMPCVINSNLTQPNAWWFMDHQNNATTVSVSGNVRMDNDETQRILAIAGIGCAYLPLDLLRADFDDNRLVPLLPDWSKESMPIYAVFPSRKFQPRRVEVFANAVAAAIRE